MTTQSSNQAYNTIFIHNKRLKERQTQTFNDLEEINKLTDETGKKIKHTLMKLRVSQKKLSNNN